jgi:hypothetical protein
MLLSLPSMYLARTPRAVNTITFPFLPAKRRVVNLYLSKNVKTPLNRRAHAQNCIVEPLSDEIYSLPHSNLNLPSATLYFFNANTASSPVLASLMISLLPSPTKPVSTLFLTHSNKPSQ